MEGAGRCVALLVLMFTFADDDLTSDTTIKRFIRRKGFGFERHNVTTEDGYILGLHRIPRPGAPVVFMQHGILASSWCWLVNSLNDPVDNSTLAPAFAIAEMGYDVWMGNSRGVPASRAHVKFAPDSAQFWNFSFNEMGLFDLPASIEYVLNSTNASNLSYVGWSQGSSAFFAASSSLSQKRSDFMRRSVNFAALLSPVSFMVHQTSNLLYAASKFQLGRLLMSTYGKGFLLGSNAMHRTEEFFCAATLGYLCKLTTSTLCGTSELDDAHNIRRLATNFPAGTSIKSLTHYEQLIDVERFGMYDYSWSSTNMKIYGRPTPPSYKLADYAVPTALFMAENDDLVNSQDAQSLVDGLRTSAVVFRETYSGFSHVTWLVGSQEAASWLRDLKGLLLERNPPFTEDITEPRRSQRPSEL